MKNKPARFTMDIPLNDHKRLKALAAIHGKTMKELVMQSLKMLLEQLEAKTKKNFFENGL